MKFALLMAAALLSTGVTLVATADEAAACIPPNCPGFGKCKIDDGTEVAYVEEPVTGTSYTVYGPGFECYY